jgi:hypothetical protein
MAKKPEILEVAFKPAKGGVVSETRTRTPRGGQGGGPSFEHDSEQGVHPTMEHAVAHLKSSLGHCFGAAPEAEVEEPKE